MKIVKEQLIIKKKKYFDEGEKNLFMVSTLFQLFGAIEAQKEFKTKNNTLVLLFYGASNSDHTQLMERLSLFDYDKLIILDKGDAKSYINLNISLIKELKKEVYTNAFVGFFSANLRRFVANIKYKRLFLLDDGVYTISIHNELYNLDAIGYKEYILPFSEKPRVGKLKKLKFKLYNNFRKEYLKFLGYKNDMNVINLGFFTMFDLPQYQNEMIVKHNFDSLKSEYGIEKKISCENCLYFLGQPLDRALGMSHGVYLMYMQDIIRKYKEEDKEFIYITHRAEDEEVVNEIGELGVEVLSLNQPFELYCLENSLNIKQIASFNSTALFSMKKLFPEIEIDVFRFPVSKAISKNIDLIHGMLYDIGADIFQWDTNGSYQIKEKESLCHL